MSGQIGVLIDLPVNRHHSFFEPMTEGSPSVKRRAVCPEMMKHFPPCSPRPPYCGQIFQITPVLGICTSAASAGFLIAVAGSDSPKSRTAP